MTSGKLKSSCPCALARGHSEAYKKYSENDFMQTKALAPLDELFSEYFFMLKNDLGTLTGHEGSFS